MVAECEMNESVEGFSDEFRIELAEITSGWLFEIFLFTLIIILMTRKGRKSK